MKAYLHVTLAMLISLVTTTGQLGAMDMLFKDTFKHALVERNFDKLTLLVKMVQKMEEGYEQKLSGLAHTADQLEQIQRDLHRLDKQLVKCILLVKTSNAGDRERYISRATLYATVGNVLLVGALLFPVLLGACVWVPMEERDRMIIPWIGLIGLATCIKGVLYCHSTRPRTYGTDYSALIIGLEHLRMQLTKLNYTVAIELLKS